MYATQYELCHHNAKMTIVLRILLMRLSAQLLSRDMLILDTYASFFKVIF